MPNSNGLIMEDTPGDNISEPLDFLQILLDLGVLERRPKRPAFLVRSAAFKGRNLAKAAPSQPQIGPSWTCANHLSQPSIFWKAFANTILPLLSNASNLTDENQAIFLSTLTQTGIPGGDQAPHEITNYQTFIRADVVQQLNHPGFSLEGESYFNLLGKYLRNSVSAADNPKIDAVREDLVKATKEKNSAWDRAAKKYRNMENGPKRPSFRDFMNSESEYNTAWARERDVQRQYTSLQGEDMGVISRQLEFIRSADDRLSHETGYQSLSSPSYNPSADKKSSYNMPCSTSDTDFARWPITHQNKNFTVDPDTVFYRPMYSLPNWETTYNNWIDSPKRKPTFYDISFNELEEVTWESLGHKMLDQGAVPRLTPHQSEAIKTLQGRLTFFGQPAVMDVQRGDWDMKAFRDEGQLPEAAPSFIKNEFCKTTKLLLCLSFEIVLTLPKTAQGISANSADHVNLSFLRVPMEIASPDGRVLKFSSGEKGYAWLIGALATVV